MPNVSRKRLLQSIRKEKNTVAGERLRACLHRKDGCSIRRICKIMVRPYSTMRDWLWRMQEGGIRCRHDKERGRRECKIPKKVFRAVRRWVKKEPSDFKFESGSWQLNLLLEMIRERFGLECNAAHASQVAAQEQSRGENPGTYRTRQPPKACKWSSSKRQESRRARCARKDTPCLQKTRLQSRRSRTQIMAGGPRAGGRRARPRFQQDRSGCLVQCQKTGSSSV